MPNNGDDKNDDS